MVIALGLRRPRVFTFPLPKREGTEAHFLAAILESLNLAPECELRSVDSTIRGEVLGEVTRLHWQPEIALVTVHADCDRIMDYGDWVFTGLHYSQLDTVADGYGRLPGYGGLTVAGPTATVRGGEVVDEGYAPAEHIPDFLVPRHVAAPVASPADVRHFLLRYLVVLPAREARQTAVALTFADTPLTH